MITVVAVVHLIVCILLIALVLLQDPKSSGGGIFGGSGASSLLGATGAVTFLTRLTRYSAVIFGLTCLVLTLLSRSETGSVIDSGVPVTAPVGAGAPATVPPSEATTTQAAPAAREQAPTEKAPAVPKNK